MGRHCSAPGCKSNYYTPGEYVPTFTFPSNPEQRLRWINAVPRENWTCTKNSSLCIKHFSPDDIVDSIIFTDADGTTQRVKCGRVTLRKGAQPCIWPGHPASTTARPKPRKPPVDRLARQKATIDDQLAVDRQAGAVKDYADLAANYLTRLPKAALEGWSVQSSDRATVFYILNCDDAPRVQVSVKVGAADPLVADVYVADEKLTKKEIAWAMTDGRLRRWSQLVSLLGRYGA